MTQALTDEGIRPLQHAGEIEGDALRAIYDHWNGLRGAQPFALKNNDYLLEFPEQARFWTIVDVVKSKNDFECRFMGSDIQALIGFDATGKCISTLIVETGGHEFMLNTQKILLMVLKACAPVLNGPKVVSIGERARYRFQALSLPFGADHSHPEQILVALEVLSVVQ